MLKKLTKKQQKVKMILKENFMKKETTTTDKDKTLESVMAQIEKQFGKGAIMKLGTT